MIKDSQKQKQKAKKRNKVSSSEDECTSTINERSGGPSSGDTQNCDVSDILLSAQGHVMSPCERCMLSPAGQLQVNSSQVKTCFYIAPYSDLE